jgi:hypothetical protein
MRSSNSRSEQATDRVRGCAIDRMRAIKSRSRSRAALLGMSLVCVIAAGMPGRAEAEESRVFAAVSTSSAERLLASGVPARPLRYALRAFECARSRGLVEGSTLTLIDYTRPSAQRRLWVIDLEGGRVRFHEYVSHGLGSGAATSTRFSNQMGSKQSSLGLFRTAETYVGRHGYSLRLDGLEDGINDRARERAIVIHGAEYATPTVARQFGRLGRSWGCPAVDPAIHRDLIDSVRGGTALFAYYPDPDWLAETDYQSCETNTASR